jgi:ribosomal protein S18 acetylase RimI-like enzyme
LKKRRKEEEKMRIRTYKKTDFNEVVELIRDTFSKYNSKDGTKKGIKNYLSHFSKNNLNEIKESFNSSDIFYVAEVDGKINGIVRGRKSKKFERSFHLSNLFISGKYHRKGIATKLYQKFESKAIKLKGKKITINSSIYAVPFYSKMGFKKIGKISYMDGVRDQKMEKRLK